MHSTHPGSCLVDCLGYSHLWSRCSVMSKNPRQAATHAFLFQTVEGLSSLANQTEPPCVPSNDSSFPEMSKGLEDPQGTCHNPTLPLISRLRTIPRPLPSQLPGLSIWNSCLWFVAQSILRKKEARGCDLVGSMLAWLVLSPEFDPQHLIEPDVHICNPCTWEVEGQEFKVIFCYKANSMPS